MYAEMQALAKKNPNDGVNQFKLGLVNNLLKRINKFLSKNPKPVDGFEVFDTTAVPTASDALFVLSQYAEALEHFRSQNIVRTIGGSWAWAVDGHASKVPTAPPKKLSS
jgi:hypothetical protein